MKYFVMISLFFLILSCERGSYEYLSQNDKDSETTDESVTVDEAVNDFDVPDS